DPKNLMILSFSQFVEHLASRTTVHFICDGYRVTDAASGQQLTIAADIGGNELLSHFQASDFIFTLQRCDYTYGEGLKNLQEIVGESEVILSGAATNYMPHEMQESLCLDSSKSPWVAAVKSSWVEPIDVDVKRTTRYIVVTFRRKSPQN